jgi:hypothetical protein
LHCGCFCYLTDFWQSETLKYLYLLFDDSRTLPLDSTSWLWSWSLQQTDHWFVLQNLCSIRRFVTRYWSIIYAHDTYFDRPILCRYSTLPFGRDSHK